MRHDRDPLVLKFPSAVAARACRMWPTANSFSRIRLFPVSTFRGRFSFVNKLHSELVKTCTLPRIVSHWDYPTGQSSRDVGKCRSLCSHGHTRIKLFRLVQQQFYFCYTLQGNVCFMSLLLLFISLLLICTCD